MSLVKLLHIYFFRYLVFHHQDTAKKHDADFFNVKSVIITIVRL